MDYSKHILACRNAQEYIEKQISSPQSVGQSLTVLYERARCSVAYEEWSVGGKSMDRGYYCPSTVRDLVVVGQSRGKLLKRPRPKSRPSFCYGFDENGRLLTVTTLQEQSGKPLRKEVLFYEGECQYGLAADVDGGSLSLCVCRYEEGTLRSYRLYFYKVGVGVDRFLAEDYQREGDGRAEITFYEFRLSNPYFEKEWTPRLYDHRRYSCYLKEDGQLVCRQTDYDTNGEGAPSFEVHVFKRGGRIIRI